MLFINPKALPGPQQLYLVMKQAEVNLLPTYAEKVNAAKVKWDGKNDAHFKVIRSTLESMCTGNNRCAYCEDSAADEVEHIKAKTIYPELVFNWDNYLYSCGPCNGPKGNKYAVITAQNVFIEGDRKRNEPINPPPSGREGFINPRVYDPLQYLYLDLLTCSFVEHPSLSGVDKAMAEYTLRILNLNTRDALRKNRVVAYQNFVSTLEFYVNIKGQGATNTQLLKVKNNILERPHQTVWHEIRRQRDNYPHITTLFEAAPELL